MKNISIIIPVFNEGPGLLIFHKALKAAISEIKGCTFTILFIDDGSTDDTFVFMRQIVNSDIDSSYIKFTRNFGKEAAILAGINSFSGDALIVMDADLQHPPSLIRNMIAQWQSGCLVVNAIRTRTKNISIWRRLGSSLFHRLMSLMSEIDLRRGVTDFCLLDAQVVEQVKSLKEVNRFFRGIIDWLGFKAEFIEFDAPEGVKNVSSYTVLGLIRLAISGITSFSLIPLKLIGIFGAILSIFSFCLLSVMVADFILFETNHFSSISYVIVTNTFFTGLLSMAIGFIAIYVGVIHSEVRGRPIYIVSSRENKHTNPHS